MISRFRFRKGFFKAKKRIQFFCNLSMSDYRRQLQLHRKTTKLCSGACCGNPRKWFRDKTRQERRFEEEWEEEDVE